VRLELWLAFGDRARQIDDRESIELEKLVSENRKLVTEARKLSAEERKLKTGAFFYPLLVGAAVLTAVAAVTRAFGPS